MNTHTHTHTHTHSGNTVVTSVAPLHAVQFWSSHYGKDIGLIESVDGGTTKRMQEMKGIEFSFLREV